MSQHDFNIGNQLFPATRTDLNNALVALASNSSGTSAPSTTYANQFWYETDTNKLKIRNESNSAWIEIATLDQSGGTVQSITTAGLTLGSTAISATGAELNQLDGITRGSILYGNASGATARLPKGSANTVLTSNGTDISWVSSTALPVTNSNPDQVSFPDFASPTNTYTTSGTWSKGTLADTDYVWIYMVDGGGGGFVTNTPGYVQGGIGGQAFLLYGQAQYFDGGAYVVGAGGAKGYNSSGLVSGLSGGKSSFTLSSANGSSVYVSNIALYVSDEEPFLVDVQGPQVTHTATQISAQFSPTSFFVVPEINHNVPSTYPTIPNILVRASAPVGTSPVGWGNSTAQRGYIDLAGNSVFGGGGGGGKHAGYGEANAIYGGKSLYGGAGADYNTGSDGAAPGGGGAGGDSQAGNGGSGSIRVYHV